MSDFVDMFPTISVYNFEDWWSGFCPGDRFDVFCCPSHIVKCATIHIFVLIIGEHWFQWNSVSCRLIVWRRFEQIFSKKKKNHYFSEMCQQDIEKHVPTFPVLIAEIWQACMLPPTLYLLSFIPMTHIKRAKINVIYFYISVLMLSGGQGTPLFSSAPRKSLKLRAQLGSPFVKGMFKVLHCH